MSSFSNPHYMYLFDLKSGKKKLAYGESPEDALSILSVRLNEDEMGEILAEQYIKISQREIAKVCRQFGVIAMRLGSEEKEVLRALVSGYQLKSHRYLDGQKIYTLHDTASDTTQPVHAATVDRLREIGLIAGNMKFPAATYMLTTEGERLAASLTSSPFRPLLARLFPGR